MASCPRCQRPVAVARAQCLYCGAALDPQVIAAVVAKAATPPPAPLEDRTLVLFDSTGLDAETLARQAGISVLDAAPRANRGWQLHRIVSPAEAAEHVARLREAGLRAQSVPAAEARPSLQPDLAEGGRATAGGLEVRTSAGVVVVPPEAVLVVVAGSIHRERQSEELRRGRLTRTLEPGFRFHVHRVHAPSPIEIDPEAFAFDEPRRPPTSSWLEIQGWVDRLVGTGVIDDTFRFVPPALGVAAPAEGDLTRALVVRPRRRGDAGPATLDNLAQFRFYSGWRAAALRGAARG
jgi:hypothetical protein